MSHTSDSSWERTTSRFFWKFCWITLIFSWVSFSTSVVQLPWDPSAYDSKGKRKLTCKSFHRETIMISSVFCPSVLPQCTSTISLCWGITVLKGQRNTLGLSSQISPKTCPSLSPTAHAFLSSQPLTTSVEQKLQKNSRSQCPTAPATRTVNPYALLQLMV